MNNPFPSVYEEVRNNYYVYEHIDPQDNQVIYVGRGSGSRAWMYVHPFRAEEHSDFLSALVAEGYLPCDWVEIIFRNLTLEESVLKEKELLGLGRPMFNKIQGASTLKITPEILEQAQKFRELGLSYKAIGEQLNLSTMTVHRAMAGKSPALEALRAGT